MNSTDKRFASSTSVHGCLIVSSVARTTAIRPTTMRTTDEINAPKTAMAIKNRLLASTSLTFGMLFPSLVGRQEALLIVAGTLEERSNQSSLLEAPRRLPPASPARPHFRERPRTAS